MDKITTISFDADGTLWDFEGGLTRIEDRLAPNRRGDVIVF